MQSIILKNFKSYQNQALTNLNSRINVIIGSNGQGKSNFFKAITFLFTEKYTINRKEFNSILNRGANPEQAEASVQAILNTNESKKDHYTISKIWKHHTNQDMKINDKSRSKEEYQNFIQSFGFSYSNPYNIVQQGKISQIASMTQNQLYLLLQEISGVKKFHKKNQQAATTLAKIQNDLSEAEQHLKFLKDKVSQVEEKKNQYEYYSVQEKIRKIKKKRQFLNYFQSIQTGLSSIKQQHFKILKEFNQKRNQQNSIIQQIQQKQRQIRKLNQQQLFYEKQQSQQIKNYPLTKNQLKQQLSRKKKYLKQIQTKLSKQQTKLNKLNQDLSILQKQLSNYRQKYEMIKTDFQIQGESNDTKKMKQAYNQKIKAQKQVIKNTEDQIKKLQNMKKQFKLIKCDKQKQQAQKLKKQKNIQQLSFNKNRSSLIQMGRKKNSLQCDLNSLNSKRKHQQQILRKILPNIDFKLLSYLQQNKIKGVYGYLLSYVNIEKDVSFAYQLAGLSKLCTLLVQDQKVASQVVLLNKRLKGKNINILPLSFIKSQLKQHRSYPKAQNAYSLLNQQWLSYTFPSGMHLQIKSCIQKIINNTFCRYMLVEDYNIALKISKQYNLNCITADKEIVYADAYMCKVGRQEYYDKGKIQIYKNYNEINRKVNDINKQVKNIEKKQVQLQNSQIQIINKLESLNLKITYLQKTIQQARKIKQTVEKLDSKRNILEQSIQRSKYNIQQYEKSLKNLQTNNKPKFKQSDLNKSKDEYFSCKSKVDALSSSLYQMQKQVSLLQKSKIQLNQEINHLQKSNQTDFIVSKQKIIKQIQKQKIQCSNMINILNDKLTRLLQQKTNLKQKQLQFLGKIIVQEQNQKHIKGKILNLGEVNQQQQDQVEQLSHSMSLKLNVDTLRNKKRQFYTAADKIFFRKISQYLDKVAEYSKTTQYLRNQKKKLQKYIQKTQKQSKKYMQTFIKNFDKNFNKYFLRIVPNGKVDLRTKIFTQKIKGVTKNGYSLQIKVSFNQQQGIRRWSQFSGGQKTVLAICIILSIQKCQPSPFCVLDEVDAALDVNYVNKIFKIIVQQSQNCQYFITSFKKQILELPEEITNYYVVKVLDRKSQMHKVQKEEIPNFFTQFAA